MVGSHAGGHVVEHPRAVSNWVNAARVVCIAVQMAAADAMLVSLSSV